MTPEEEARQRGLSQVFMNPAPVYYANMVQVSATAFDVRMSFSISDLTGRPAVYVNHVYLTMPVAKYLHQLLGSMLSSYEEKFGEIRTEPKKP